MRVTPLAAVLLFPLVLAGAPALAQTPGEISFWESVRDSRNPAELQAYIDQYPNGVFVVLAKSRLAGLEKSAPTAPAARPAAPAVAVAPPRRLSAAERMPQAGDTWVYRLSVPPRFGIRGEPPRTYVVKVGAVADGQITDQVAIDGGTPSEAGLQAGTYLLTQGVSIFSPYLIAFRDLPERWSIGSVDILDPACSGRYVCNASARVTGYETVNVPAGRFNAVKVLVSQNWRSSGSSSGAATITGMTGGRTLTVWYVPELKRAVKFASRLTVGDIPPVDPHFDLELISYQVK